MFDDHFVPPQVHWIHKIFKATHITMIDLKVKPTLSIMATKDPFTYSGEFSLPSELESQA